MQIRPYRESDWPAVREIYDLSKPDELRGVPSDHSCSVTPMTRHTSRKAILGWLALMAGSLAVAGPADAQNPGCRVPPFAGASLPAGATATMQVVNDGQPCGITLYGMPAQSRNPATDGAILKQPKHGKAEFVGARLQYTPDPGFVGDDEFSCQAWATGESQAPRLLKVNMTVHVLAPK